MPQEVLTIVLPFVFAMTALGCVTQVITTALKRRRPLPSNELNEIRNALARIEQAVETTAIEVERIGEAERFTSKLLAERPASDARPASHPARVITPH